MKTAIIIGASSGIGRSLAIMLSRDGYRVGVVARRSELLTRLRDELTGPCVAKTVDISQPESAIPIVQQLIQELGGVDLFVISAGTGFENPELAWEPERETIAVNVVGFAAMVHVAAAHFQVRGSGHLVAITSVAALRGFGGAPAYAASKAFMANYLEGIRYRFRKRGLPVVVTNVQPGFVDTRMAGGRFWIASPETAAQQIVEVIRTRKEHVYVTRRWRLVAWIMRVIPDALWSKL